VYFPPAAELQFQASEVQFPRLKGTPDIKLLFFLKELLHTPEKEILREGEREI
jgi:hypothetical protein